MNTETKSSPRRCGSICCLFGVAAVLVIVLWYVRIIPLPGGSSEGGQGDDSALTAKRVDRLSFFNVSGETGTVTAKITLYKDYDWSVAWDYDDEVTLEAENGQADGFVFNKVEPMNAKRLKSALCVVTRPDGKVWGCYIRAQPGFWIATTTFWYGKDKDNNGDLRLCGEILQSNGSLETHTKDEEIAE